METVNVFGPLPLCPECQERPIHQNCLHCKKDVCIPCLEAHMKPILSAAAELCREQRKQEEEKRAEEAAEQAAEEVAAFIQEKAGDLARRQAQYDEDEDGDEIATEMLELNNGGIPIMIRMRARVLRDPIPEDQIIRPKNWAKRQEEEKLRIEEAKKQEDEQQKQEEVKRQQEERLRQEEAQKKEEERKRQEAKKREEERLKQEAKKKEEEQKRQEAKKREEERIKQEEAKKKEQQKKLEEEKQKEAKRKEKEKADKEKTSLVAQNKKTARPPGISEEAIKAYYKFKTELDEKVMNKYKELLGLEEIRILVFIAQYVTQQLLPYQQCFLACLYFRRHLDDFKTFCTEKLSKAPAEIPVKEMIYIQKFCQNFMTMFRQIRAEMVKEPTKIKLPAHIIQVLETKLRLITKDDSALSGFFERKIKHFTAVKNSPFVILLHQGEVQENCEFTKHPLTANVVFEESDLGDLGSIRAETRLRSTFCLTYLNMRKKFNDHVLKSTCKLNGKPYTISRESEPVNTVYKSTLEQVAQLPESSKVITEDDFCVETLQNLQLAIQRGKKQQSEGLIEKNINGNDLLDKVMQREGILPFNPDRSSDLTFKAEIDMPFSLTPSDEGNSGDGPHRAMITSWADPGDANYEAYCERTKLEKVEPMKTLTREELDDLLEHKIPKLQEQEAARKVYLFPNSNADPAKIKSLLDECPDLLDKVHEASRNNWNDDANMDIMQPRSEKPVMIQHDKYTIYGCNVGHMAPNGQFIPSLDDYDLDGDTNKKQVKTSAERRRERRSARANSNKRKSKAVTHVKSMDSHAEEKKIIEHVEPVRPAIREASPSSTSSLSSDEPDVVPDDVIMKNVVLDHPEDLVTMEEFFKIIDVVD